MAKTVVTTDSVTDSVEVSVNAKGDYSYTAKVYFSDGETEAEAKLERIDAWFKAKYRTAQQ